MNTNYSAAQLMHFAEQGLLDKFEMAHLLPPATEVDFLRACEDVEKALTRACTDHGDHCLASGCAMEGESCLNAILNAGPGTTRRADDGGLPSSATRRIAVRAGASDECSTRLTRCIRAGWMETGGDAMKDESITGHVRPGFEPVVSTFAENFDCRGELGGACAAYHRGEKVVDIWGGVRNKATGEPWQEDTMVIVYSATKGLAAMTLAIAHSRGWLDYEERVCAYWPEFAQQGKGRITVRQLLAHQAGLLCARRTRGSRPRRRSRSSRRRARPSEASMGAGHAPGVSRHHARLLRK